MFFSSVRSHVYMFMIMLIWYGVYILRNYTLNCWKSDRGCRSVYIVVPTSTTDVISLCFIKRLRFQYPVFMYFVKKKKKKIIPRVINTYPLNTLPMKRFKFRPLPVVHGHRSMRVLNHFMSLSHRLWYKISVFRSSTRARDIQTVWQWKCHELGMLVLGPNCMIPYIPCIKEGD